MQRLAAIALANKTARMAWAMLRHDADYQAATTTLMTYLLMIFRAFFPRKFSVGCIRRATAFAQIWLRHPQCLKCLVTCWTNRTGHSQA